MGSLDTPYFNFGGHVLRYDKNSGSRVDIRGYRGGPNGMAQLDSNPSFTQTRPASTQRLPQAKKGGERPQVPSASSWDKTRAFLGKEKRGRITSYCPTDSLVR